VITKYHVPEALFCAKFICDEFVHSWSADKHFPGRFSPVSEVRWLPSGRVERNAGAGKWCRSHDGSGVSKGGAVV